MSDHVQTTDNRVTDPRAAESALYHQMTDDIRDNAAAALSRQPYFSTRPPEDPAVQKQIARESAG